MSLDWGNVPAWASMLVTTAGFGATVYQLRLGRRDRLEASERGRNEESERRRAMASAVGVKVSWGGTDESRGVTPVTIEVMNGSPYPIGTVVLVIDADDYPMEVVIGTLLGGEKIWDTYEVRRSFLAFGELTTGATLRFTDVYGQHWARTPYDLAAMESPPRIC